MKRLANGFRSFLIFIYLFNNLLDRKSRVLGKKHSGKLKKKSVTEVLLSTTFVSEKSP